MIFISPPGAGKGTHAVHVSEHFGIPKISLGEIFREEVKRGTGLGKKLDSYMKKGVLVPDEISIKTLKNRLSKHDCKKGFILDGYPRNLEQAEALEGITKIDLVVNFFVSDKTLMQRLGGRITCKKCAAIFHKTNRIPKKEGVCDECGGELYIREDQKPEVIKQRLETYEEETKPLIDYYRKKGIMKDFSGEGEIEEVKQRMLKFLEDIFKK